MQTHEQHDNSMVLCTIGALAMHPTSNAQGNYYFFSLLSTRQISINCAHATKLLMPDDVIERVHALMHHQKANPGLVFLNHNQVLDGPLNEQDDSNADDDDSDYMPREKDDDLVNEQDDDKDDDGGDTNPNDDFNA